MDILKLQEFFLTCGLAVGALLLTTLLLKRKNRGYLLLSLIVIVAISRQLIIVLMTKNPSQQHILITLHTFLGSSLMPLVYYYIWYFTHPLNSFKGKNFFYIFAASFFIAGMIYGLEKIFQQDIINYIGITVSVAIALPLLFGVRTNIKSFEQLVKNNFSDTFKIHLLWVKLLAQISFVIIAFNLIDVFSGPNVPIWKLSPVFSTLAIFAMIFFILNYSKFFDGVKKVLIENASKNGEPPFSPEEAQKYENKLMDLLEKDKPYLNTQFTLRDLSSGLGLKPYKTSVLINSVLKTNFYTLINSKRIDHAKKLLLDPQASHLNMLGIADQSGFNSKSVFNDAFKKITGMTPKQYRAQNLHKPDRII